MASSAMLASSPVAAPGAEKLALDLLCGLLEREHDALMGRDVELIGSIATEKQLLLDQLALLVKARTSRGLPRSRFASPTSADPALRALWKKVEAKNSINAAVLTLHASVVARALGVMRQAVGSDGPYNARGKLAGHYLAS